MLQASRNCLARNFHLLRAQGPYQLNAVTALREDATCKFTVDKSGICGPRKEIRFVTNLARRLRWRGKDHANLGNLLARILFVSCV